MLQWPFDLITHAKDTVAPLKLKINMFLLVDVGLNSITFERNWHYKEETQDGSCPLHAEDDEETQSFHLHNQF